MRCLGILILLFVIDGWAANITPNISGCLRIRTYPRTGKTRKCVPSGHKLRIIKKRGNWVKVNYGGGSGWAFRPMTQRYTSPGSKVAETSANSFIYPRVTANSCVRLRSRSRSNSKVLSCVRPGKKMQVLGQSGSRVKVKVDGKVGYVARNYTQEKNVEPEAKPIVQRPSVFDSQNHLSVDNSEKYKAKWKRDSYSRYVSDAIDQVGSGLLSRTPRDIKNWCPNFKNLNRQDKKKFWVFLMSSLSVFESNHRTGVTFKEPGSLRGGCAAGGRVISRGLLQLSAKSAGLYSRYGCKTRQGRKFTCSSRSQLHDPRINLTCGVAIMNRWVTKDGAIKGGGNRGAARYWSPFRSSSKRRKMQRWAKSLNVCKRGYRSPRSIVQRTSTAVNRVLESVGLQ